MPSKELKTALLALQRANEALKAVGNSVDLTPLKNALKGKADDSDVTDLALKLELIAANQSEMAEKGHEHEDYALRSALEGLSASLQGYALKGHVHDYVKPHQLEGLTQELVDRLAPKEHKHSHIEWLIQSVERGLTAHKSEAHLTRKQIREMIKQYAPAMPAAKPGEPGQIGPMPKHEAKINETSVWLRFEVGVGKWGEWIKIKLPRIGGGVPLATVQKLIAESAADRGTLSQNVRIASEDTTLTEDDDILLCVEGLTVTLPAEDYGKTYRIKRSGLGDVVITGGLIDGLPTFVLNAPYSAVDVHKAAGEWVILG